MRTSFLSLLLLIAVLMAATGCISTKKYEEMQLAKEYWESEADAIDSLRQQYRALQEESRATDIQLTDAFQELERLTATNRNLKRNYEEILSRYNELLSQNQRVVYASSEQEQLLQEELADKQAELDQKERELEQRAAQLNAANPQNYGFDQTGNRLKEVLQQQAATLEQLQTAMMQGLRGFNSSVVNVSERGGKVYVALSEDLLFANNSRQISAQGQQAVGRIVQVLRSYPSMNILVEGHTDTDGTATENWENSVLHATTMVKAMTEAGTDPTRITAAGRGFYYPLASNVTEAGKARNRRVEVILSPDTEILYGLLNNQ